MVKGPDFKLESEASRPVVMSMLVLVEGLPRLSFLHSAVLQAVRGEAAIGLTAAFCTLDLRLYPPGLPALSQRLHEQGQGGEEIAEPGQVEGTVVRLGVVVQEACERRRDVRSMTL